MSAENGSKNIKYGPQNGIQNHFLFFREPFRVLKIKEPFLEVQKAGSPERTKKILFRTFIS